MKLLAQAVRYGARRRVQRHGEGAAGQAHQGMVWADITLLLRLGQHCAATLRQLLDQGVAGGITQGLVDGLQARQIEQQQSVVRRIRRLGWVQQSRAIGQAGQAVLKREAHDLLLPLGHRASQGVERPAHPVHFAGACDRHTVGVIALRQGARTRF